MARTKNVRADMFNPPTSLPEVAPVRPPPEPEPTPREELDEGSAVVRAAAKRPPKGSTLRREVPGARLVLNLPPDLIKSLRLLCVEEGRSLSNAAELAIREFITNRTKGI